MLTRRPLETEQTQLRIVVSATELILFADRPKTFLHGQGAAVGIAIFNSIGAIGESYNVLLLHKHSINILLTPAETADRLHWCMPEAVNCDRH